MNWAIEGADQILALWKHCLSFRKRHWELSDYPVASRTQEPDTSSPYNSSRFKFHRHVALIVNWHLSGTGESRIEAIESLRKTFAEVKAKRRETGESLPRPGTSVPIKFASQERVNADPALRDDFIHLVLGFEWAFVSDGSSLWDFHTEETNDSYCTKIKEIYGVDVSDIESAKISEILERIAGSRGRP